MHAVAIWLPVVSVAVVYIGRLMELRTRRDTIAGPVSETLTLRLFKLAGTLLVVGSLTEYFWRGRQLEPISYGLGCACAIASFAIRRRAIAALGKFWSLHIEIRENHQFVRSGPFRWMRHPTYFSMILELLVGALMLNVYWPLLAVSALFIPTLFMRIRLEEAALVDKFGPAYQEYQRTTPALFPYKGPQST
jgi:protein-S-isoprenylcysteine O-methyltransferase Ste14